MKALQDFGIRLKSYSNGNHKVTCPKCSHTRANKHDACLSVTIDGDGFVYNCHHCGWNGGSKNNVVYMKKTYRKPEYKPEVTKVSKVFEYLSKRGISKEVGENLGVGLVKRFMPQTSKEEWCIAFPFYRGGEVVNVKYRTVDKDFAQEKDCEKVFYNIDSIKNQEFAIYTEGEIDALSFIEAGFTSVVSVPDGAPNSEVKQGSKKLEYIENCADEILTVKKHYLAFDNDKNGRILTEEVATRLGKVNCWLIDFGDCKDANEFLVKHGTEALKVLFSEAKPFPLEGFFDFNLSNCDLIQDYLLNGEKEIYSTGWAALDKFYKVRRGELTIVSGVPNNGKSEFLDNLILNLAEHSGFKFGVCSFENPEIIHSVKFFEKINKERKKFTRDIGRFMVRGMAFLKEHIFFYKNDQDQMDIDYILARASELVLRHDILGLVIDPYNQIYHNRPANLNEHEHIGQMLRKIRAFAKTYNIHIWLVAHPKKVGKDEIPSGYDISGSANWLNMPDNLLVVHRDKDNQGVYTGETSVHIQKVRFQPDVGGCGCAKLRFNFKEARFYE